MESVATTNKKDVKSLKGELRSIGTLFEIYDKIVNKYINSGMEKDARSKSLYDLKEILNDDRKFSFKSDSEHSLNESDTLNDKQLSDITAIIENTIRVEDVIKEIGDILANPNISEDKVDFKHIYQEKNLQNILKFIEENTISQEMINRHQGLTADLSEFFLRGANALCNLSNQVFPNSLKENLENSSTETYSIVKEEEGRDIKTKMQENFELIKQKFTEKFTRKHVDGILNNKNYIRENRGNIEAYFTKKDTNNGLINYDIFKNCAKIMEDMQRQISELAKIAHKPQIQIINDYIKKSDQLYHSEYIYENNKKQKKTFERTNHYEKGFNVLNKLPNNKLPNNKLTKQ